MRLTFTFTDTADLASLYRDELYPVHFEFPDEALQLPDIRERIMAIAECIGKLTDAVLHISCKDLSIKYHPIRTEKTSGFEIKLYFPEMHLLFEKFLGRGYNKRLLKVYLPIRSSDLVPPSWYLPASKSKREKQKAQKRWLSTLRLHSGTEGQKAYASTIDTLVEQCLTLLNTEPIYNSQRPWTFKGFHPERSSRKFSTRSISSIIRGKNTLREKERIKQEKQEERRKAHEEKLAQKMVDMGKTPTEPPKTGAGRRVGAVPGVFMGITFRSQLEIRFVTQLEAKKIRWIYEGERLGEGQYLVDFYLPDLKCWVEVKGRLEPRDDYLLKEVAGYLKREREERLFIYTQSKAYSVSTSQFREMTHNEFWAKL